MQTTELSNLLESQLGITDPPVALAFVDEQPSGVPRTDSVVPSACAFWRQAEQGTFFAAAEDHFNCPLGAMVMGFSLPEQQMAQLQEEVGMMCGISYVREEEVPNVPKVSRASAGIVYGPLAGFPRRARCRRAVVHTPSGDEDERVLWPDQLGGQPYRNVWTPGMCRHSGGSGLGITIPVFRLCRYADQHGSGGKTSCLWWSPRASCRPSVPACHRCPKFTSRWNPTTRNRLANLSQSH